MTDKGKTKKQLLEEIAELRQRLGAFETAPAEAGLALQQPASFAGEGVEHNQAAASPVANIDTAESKFRSLLESAPNAMVITNSTGIIELVNAQTEKLFGYQREEMIGQPSEMLLPERFHERYREDRRHYFHDPATHIFGLDLEMAGQRKDGREFPLELSLSPLQTHDGIVAISTIRDISERKRAEAERSHSLTREQAARKEAEAASRAKDEFMSRISGELRAPLTSILGWTQVLHAERLSKEAARAVEMIERNIRLQVQLVDELLDVSRIITGNLNLRVRPLKIATIIEAALESVALAANAKSIQLICTLFTPQAVILGDVNRLQQALWNLLSNAIKYTPKHGSIELRLNTVESNVEIKVIDTGQGIRADQLPYIFDRFRHPDGANRKEGHGFGLAAVRNLIELHGGLVQATSKGEGRGTTFTITIPLASPSDLGGETATPQSQPAATAKLTPPATTTQPPVTQRAIPESKPPQPKVKPEVQKTVEVQKVVEVEKTVEPRAAVTNRPIIEPRSLIESQAEPALLKGVSILLVDIVAQSRQQLGELLQRRGAEVMAADSIEVAMAMLDRRVPDLLISDLSNLVEDRYALIRYIRQRNQDRGGKIPAIAITSSTIIDEHWRALLAGYQANIFRPIDARELLTTIARLTGKTVKAS